MPKVGLTAESLAGPRAPAQGRNTERSRSSKDKGGKQAESDQQLKPRVGYSTAAVSGSAGSLWPKQRTSFKVADPSSLRHMDSKLLL